MARMSTVQQPVGVGERAARKPDVEGWVDRDGVSVAYKVYGDGAATVVLMPTWSIVPSRFWKAQVPYLARHFRVITFDGRGAGQSDAPSGDGAYADQEFVADALAVLDATGTANCVLVGLSRGALWSLQLTLEQPDRVLGVIAISPAVPLIEENLERSQAMWNDQHDRTQYNRRHWLEKGTDDFLPWFFRRMFPEPHSSKQIEDAIGWGRQISPERLADTEEARNKGWSLDVGRELGAVSCPVLVVHGDDDRIRPPAEGLMLAELTGGSLVTVAGGGHGIPGRDPILVNRLVKEFVDQVSPAQTRRTWVRPLNRPKRALYLSSPIGLGHARRDLAIAGELRKHHPDLHVDWLAQHPVTQVLDDAGERVHPASRWLANESAHLEFEADEHDLHAFQAIRRMDEILVNNFMVFNDVVDGEHYDLVVSDEAWDVDYFLHENPELKRFAYAWMTDFVGWLPMPSGGAPEAALTADYNAEMIEQRARFRRLRDRSIFIGQPDDIVEDSFGPGLPRIREWTSANFDFSGYATGFDPAEVADRDALRQRLGYARDALLCVVTVGGSGVGTALLRRVLDAVPLARRLVPELQFVVVAGPRIDPASLPPRRGVTVAGYLPNLYQHLAAADLAVVQGGLTTCMELTASRTPFIYVPLRNHFEQNFHVRKRLDRYSAGRFLPYDEAADPNTLAEAIVKDLRREVLYRPVETGGAARAAALLADLL